jgi:hypothetical protein
MWKLKGDLVLREFFLAVKQRPQVATIASLVDNVGVCVIDRAGIEQVVTSFYTQLYVAPLVTPEQEQAKEVILGHVPPSFATQFSAVVLKRLAQSLSASELKTTLAGMATDQSPRPDEIMTEFYSRFWDIIGEDFIEMINHAIEIDRLPAGMTSGLIVLLPKDGDRKLLSNWFIIILLNSAYNFFAKALQIRLQGLLPDVIQEDQLAFLPLRFILDKVMVEHETISWAH